MSTYTVILDACVLYPAPLRSYLLYLAQTGLYRARWSNFIHDEWIRNALKNNPNLHPEALVRTRALMDKHAVSPLVLGFEQLINSIDLPDKNDRHVVAAAIVGQAEGIITFNLKDFPDEPLAEFGLSAIHPDIFLSDMFELNQSVVVGAAQRHRRGLQNPPMTAQAYLDCLQRQKLPRFVSKLSEFAALL